MKNALILLLIMSFQAAWAEKLIFSNNNEQVDITDDVEIDFETGDVTVTTVGEHFIVDSDDDTPVILGFYPSDYDIATGGSITVNWSVAFAVSCSAQTTSGVATWSGAKTATNGSHAQAGVTVSTLPATLQLTCLNGASSSTTKSFLITEQSGGGGGGGSPSITSFRVNSQSPFATVGPSTTASVTWTTSNTTSCTASANPAVAGWSGAVATQGPTSVTINADTVMTLNCNGVTRTVTVTYSSIEGCENTTFPPGLTMVQGSYETYNDEQPFGASTNITFELDISNTQFYALSGFSLPADTQFNIRRRITLEDAPTQRQINQSTMSISECPGDFSPQSATCVIPISGSLPTSIAKFSTVPTDDNTFCILDPSKTYYANFVNSPSPFTQPPSCELGHSACTIFYAEGLQAP